MNRLDMVLKLKAGNGGREFNRPQLKKTHANRRKHMQIKETSSSVSLHTCAPNTHNFERISVFGCVVSIWSILECCETDEDVFLIWGCFFLHVFFSICMYYLQLRHTNLSLSRLSTVEPTMAGQ